MIVQIKDLQVGDVFLYFKNNKIFCYKLLKICKSSYVVSGGISYKKYDGDSTRQNGKPREYLVEKREMDVSKHTGKTRIPAWHGWTGLREVYLLNKN